ncbi:AMP-binding protein [Actinophytocola gossypii]|uniref:AMP-binding protein n=1 Tax=Actinophytocola gossypii TaxID=2812003 RepID=A0ABT2JF25_9PSEU|nr:AMP-binding protein [Actinophytocola gossypii]MCT2586353.1 AMP-binding protein [Actinophytocola gossypii]
MTAPGEPLPTVTELLLARAEDVNPGLLFEDIRWTWADHVQESANRAALLAGLRRPGPFHVGVLMDNVPEYSLLLGGAAFAGAVLVGLNTARRGDALVRDVRRADCQVVITDSRYVELLQGLDLGARVLDIDSAAWHVTMYRHTHSPLEPVPASPDDPLVLTFTSGTGGEPKPVCHTHGTVAGAGRAIASRHDVGTGDTVYLSMPMFHSSSVTAGWSVGLAAGAAVALRRRFSASGFVDDVRRHGATYAHYVGRPLAYVLSTPPDEDDRDNPLRVACGSGASAMDAAEFAERFGCEVVDTYHATEGAIDVPRPPGTPPGSIGRLEGGPEVLDPETGKPCPPAVLDAGGRVANPDAVGELTTTADAFAGYYRDADADAERVRDGVFWSGDLAYRDEDGYCFLVGRSGEWPGAVRLERILSRHPDVGEVAVYTVPAPDVGEQLMAALVLRAEAVFDPDAFAEFLAAQEDLEPAEVPRFVRLTARLPRTATFRVLRRTLTAQRWRSPDPVWWREGPELRFEPLTASSDPIRLDWGARSVRG